MQQMYDFLDEQKFEMPFTLNPPAVHLKRKSVFASQTSIGNMENTSLDESIKLDAGEQRYLEKNI